MSVTVVDGAEHSESYFDGDDMAERDLLTLDEKWLIFRNHTFLFLLSVCICVLCTAVTGCQNPFYPLIVNICLLSTEAKWTVHA